MLGELELPVTHSAERHANQNLTAFEEHVAFHHPQFTHLPDYGLALDPKTDDRLRAAAEASGIDYDRIARQFSLGHQVIPSRTGFNFVGELLRKCAIPVNILPAYFEGYLQCEIARAKNQECPTVAKI